MGSRFTLQKSMTLRDLEQSNSSCLRNIINDDVLFVYLSYLFKLQSVHNPLRHVDLQTFYC